MQQSIYKFPLEVTDVQTVDVENFKYIVGLEVQREIPVLYCMIDPIKHNTTKLTIHCVGTGHPAGRIDDDFQFLGTAKLSGGGLMFHFFLDNRWIKEVTESRMTTAHFETSD